MTLDEISQGRNNNLDIIRFVAAILVIFSHSFPIAGGGVADPLSLWTNGQLAFGGVAVSVFFFYGGFLICKSMFRLKTFRKYFRARAMRIFPSLFAVCGVMAFIAGPVLTELEMPEYFKDAGTYRYMLNGILVLQHDLPGVFLYNVYGRTVNGSLWTLPVEFLCYCMCYIMYRLKWLKQEKMGWVTVLFIVGCIGIRILSVWVPILSAVIRPVGLFYAGMVCFLYRERIRMSRRLFYVAALGLVVSLMGGIFNYTMFILLPYVLLYIGYATEYKLSGFARHGEISYGIYLCAWPVQQVICQLWGGRMVPYVNFFLSVPITIILGVLLCKWLEEPLTKRLRKKLGGSVNENTIIPNINAGQDGKEIEGDL